MKRLDRSGLITRPLQNVLLLIVICCLIIPVSPVEAHVLKSDGSIGTVMYVDPDDDPIVGQVAQFYFEFKDRESKFDHQNCDCRVEVLKNGLWMGGDELVKSGFRFVFFGA